MENPICVSVSPDLKQHKCDNPLQNTFLDRFAKENPICVSVNPDLKQHKCDNLSQNTSFWPFNNWKSDLYKSQARLRTTQMQ